MDNKTAKDHLDTVIRKARVHFYKPIQIAEILRRDRIEKDIDLGDLETYRTPSRKWRDEISLRFIGRISTSSARYQDDLFNANATPPTVLSQLGKINRDSNGVVETYIYTALRNRLSQMSSGLSIVLQSDSNSFTLRNFIDSFTRDPGLSRSVDKIFEIVVYALFSTLLEVLDVKIGVRIDNINNTVLSEFSDFTEKVLGLSDDTPELYQAAKVYRVGVTNAADRGLDMWANFGVAIQIKHISLTPTTIKDISSTISADRIIIVCKESEKDVLVSVLKQFGSASRIQSVITEDELEEWYEKALRGQSSELIGDKVLQKLANEIKVEFPSTTSEFDNFFKERGYDHLSLVDF
ncbi:HaeII family restriction endonuclease [Candidatus Poribacteria bacterium]|nr:HaeII family restriction endonuclease [Candidatus Poribacteria bacterium]MYB01021.1 HaeII family restriction endonuclease [Candidatus Poribacteria bacterium]